MRTFTMKITGLKCAFHNYARLNRLQKKRSHPGQYCAAMTGAGYNRPMPSEANIFLFRGLNWKAR